MTEEQTSLEPQGKELPPAEGNPAPEQAETAKPESADNNAPDATEEPKKVFSQEELDAAIGKRLAREQRKWEREQAARQAEAQQRSIVPEGEIKLDQFESPEAYAEALAERVAEKKLEALNRQKEQFQTLEAYQDREEEARGKYDDFDDVVQNPNLRITEVMAETIRSSDIGPDVAYWLGSNPKEADRIARLSPLLQAREIGKIEAKVVGNPPVKKLTSAPEPISPVTSRASGSPAYDTTDPRSIKAMSASQWIEAERNRQMRKLEAQRNR